MGMGLPPVLAVLLVLLLGLAIGICNGFFVYEIELPPMIATLAVQTILRGATYIMTGGLPVYGLPKSFNTWGRFPCR